jgi:hypothetical protein
MTDWLGSWLELLVVSAILVLLSAKNSGPSQPFLLLFTTFIVHLTLGGVEWLAIGYASSGGLPDHFNVIYTYFCIDCSLFGSANAHIYSHEQEKFIYRKPRSNSVVKHAHCLADNVYSWCILSYASS